METSEKEETEKDTELRSEITCNKYHVCMFTAIILKLSEKQKIPKSRKTILKTHFLIT